MNIFILLSRLLARLRLNFKTLLLRTLFVRERKNCDLVTNFKSIFYLYWYNVAKGAEDRDDDVIEDKLFLYGQDLERHDQGR